MTNKAFHVIDQGRVKATIWHEKRNGVTRFNVAFTRVPRSEERWWDTTSFKRDDMLPLARLAEDVHTWICQQLNAQNQVDDEETLEGTS
jgi:hypothetical protein